MGHFQGTQAGLFIFGKHGDAPVVVKLDVELQDVPRAHLRQELLAILAGEPGREEHEVGGRLLHGLVLLLLKLLGGLLVEDW